jgi:drug/metabolite transporter (DMT)-like permease
MKAVYRTVSALLAVVAGLVLALLVTAVADGRDISFAGYAVYILGTLIAGGTAIALWSKALKRR